MRILVCVDGSGDARVALERAAAFAAAGGYARGYHKLFVVRVATDGAPEARLALRDELARQADALAAVWCESECIEAAADGVAEALLARASKLKCARLFVGAHGARRSALGRLRAGELGRTAKALIDGAPRDTRVHVCRLGSEVVDVYPKRRMDDKLREKLVRRATAAGIKQAESVVRVYERFDTDESQELDSTELRRVLEALSVDVDSEQVQAAIKKVDEDGSATLDFAEFIKLLNLLEEAGIDYACKLEQAKSAPCGQKATLSLPGVGAATAATAAAVKKGRRKSVEFVKKILPHM